MLNQISTWRSYSIENVFVHFAGGELLYLQCICTTRSSATTIITGVLAECYGVITLQKQPPWTFVIDSGFSGSYNFTNISQPFEAAMLKLLLVVSYEIPQVVPWVCRK